jgi:transcriptional regulator with XRE-family HTH domain
MTPRRDDKLIRQITGRIRELRKARGLTQDAVYEDTNVDVRHIESKGTNVTVTTVAILCSYFEITLEEFFRGIETSSDLNQWN